jgi:hypothetical protein
MKFVFIIFGIFFFFFFFLSLHGGLEAMEDHSESDDEMEDDMDFRAIERPNVQSCRNPYHLPCHIERPNSPSGSVFSEFSTFSADEFGRDEIGNFSFIDDLIDAPAFGEALYEFIEADEILMDKSLKEKKSRDRGDKIDYWQTKWGEMLRDPNSRNEHTRAGKLWNRRFRAPRAVVDMIIEKCNEGNIFCTKD